MRIGDYWGPRYMKDQEGVSMVVAMNDVGDDLLGKLKAHHRIELEEKECKEYWSVQYPINPIKPVFYNELMEDIQCEAKPLDETADFYCSGLEFYKKLSKPYKTVLSLIKGRGQNEQKR